MEIRISDVMQSLADIAPWELQENYDNSGLLIGDPGQVVSGILISVDVTESIVSEAIEKSCNLIISHHPLIFRGLKRLIPVSYVERSVIKAISNNIAIAAVHTNLDNVQNGVNSMLAQKLGLIDTAILSPKIHQLRKLVTYCPHSHADQVRGALFGAGAGQIGNYDSCSYNSEGYGTFRAGSGAQPFVGEAGKLHHENETKIETIVPVFRLQHAIKAMKEAHPYEEVAYDVYMLENLSIQTGSGLIGTLAKPLSEIDFLALCNKAFGTACIRHTALMGKAVQKIAVCGGSGAFLIDEAERNRADAYVTSDIKYHDFFDASGRLLLIDAGHYETEQYTKELIRDIIVKKIPTFAPSISEVNTNPVNYYHANQ
jgi:dinuclear metal center YbgI/SA1388 family protein